RFVPSPVSRKRDAIVPGSAIVAQSHKLAEPLRQGAALGQGGEEPVQLFVARPVAAARADPRGVRKGPDHDAGVEGLRRGGLRVALARHERDQSCLAGLRPLGGLYVADPDGLRLASPTYFSQDALEVDGSFVPKPGAQRFDTGWLAVPSLAGLLAALDAAPDWRFERGREIAERCRERLVEAGFAVRTEPGQAGLVTFEPREGDPEAAAAKALDAGVVIRALPNTPWIRASCGYWTSDEDVDRLLAALA
ncbi:MAG: L-cysteine/cystine lyase, partial [Gaiellaceae bacterium]|nr:L-cysteine/cystine lyase [Gaiellaceae bacterium]